MAYVDLYINTSMRNVVNKSLTPLGQSIVLLYKEPCDILHPVVIIEAGEAKSGLIQTNYVYLSDFKRYYYAKVTVEHQRIILTCEVDVLVSFKDYFKDNQAIAKRNSKKYNLYLNDSEFVGYQYNTVYLKKFPNSFSKDLEFILAVGG